MQGSSVHIIILIAFSALLYIPRLGEPDLWGSSELRYAEVAKETFEGDHWVIPYFNGEVYYSKPPLFFSAVALLSKFTGEVTEVTARLPAALSALGTVVVTYFLGKNLFNPRAGLLAALMLACSPKFHYYAREVRLDTMNTLLITSAMASFYYGYTYKQRTYLLLSGFTIGLAMLTKGPLILYFVATSIFFYLAYCRDLRFLLTKDSLLGVIVLLLTLLAWILPAYMEGGRSYFNGFAAENFTTYARKHIHLETLYGYLGDIFIGAAPWSLFFPLALYRYLSNGKGHEATEPLTIKKTMFPLIWMTVIFTCFCLTFNRRSPYLLPIYPPLSILVAQFFDARISDLSQTGLPKTHAFILYSMAVAVGLLTGKAANNPAISPQYVLIATLVSIAFLVVVGALSIQRKSLHPLFISSLISLSVCAVSADFYFLPKANKSVSTKALCKEIQNLAKTGATLGIYKEPPLNYTFYTNARIRPIATEDDLAKLLDSSERAYCLMSLKDYQSLKKYASRFQTKELIADKRYLIVFK